MSLATAELPTDPEALRAFAAAPQAELYAKTLHIESYDRNWVMAV